MLLSDFRFIINQSTHHPLGLGYPTDGINFEGCRHLSMYLYLYLCRVSVSVSVSAGNDTDPEGDSLVTQTL